MRRAAFWIVLVCSITPFRYTTAQAPTPPAAPVIGNAEFVWNDDRSGPRLGVAYIVGGSVTAEKEGKTFSPLTSLFGWQIEHQFSTGRRDLPVPLTELIMLAGGMEQGRFLPSMSWLLGVRKQDGWEAALGPTLTATGVQLAFAAGVTHSFGDLNVPVNLAVAPGRRGASISVTTGFNMRR